MGCAAAPFFWKEKRGEKDRRVYQEIYILGAYFYVEYLVVFYGELEN